MNERRVREIIDEVIWSALQKQPPAPTVEEIIAKMRFPPTVFPAPTQPLLPPALSVPVVLPEDSMAADAQTVLHYLQAAEVAKRLKLSDVAKVCVARAKDRLRERWSDGSAGFGPTEPEEEDAP